MILQALYEYYRRKAEDPQNQLAPWGWEWKEIPFVIVLNEQGEFMDLQDMREGAGKKKTAKPLLVPQAVKRASGIASNMLWDGPGYVFGVDRKGKPERAKEQQRAFMQAILDAFPEEARDAGIRSVLTFLEKARFEPIFSHPAWEEIQKTGANLTFRLQGKAEMICQSPAVQEAISRQASAEGNTVHCLISGTEDVIERLHPAIKGVWGAQTSGANIVSFNLDAFNSWGKTQGANAPVGKKAAFAYTTALNHLLAKDSRQRIQIGDASTVFWAEKPGHPMESQFGDLFSEPPKDDLDRNTEAVKSLYRSPETGASMFDNDGTRFYVLGLAPNAARIAVRFWHTASISDLAAQFRQHFEDIAIAHAPHEPETLSLFRLAVSTAVQSKSENIPPNLMGDFMKSILTGLPYPQTLLQAAIRRSRAEQAVTYPRAALIKACVNRLTRSANPVYQEELKVSLDPSNTNAGYRLGRLFAALEKIQEDANHGINATIRDRFYGAASSTPVTVFTTLLRLKNHHISKLKGEKPGLAVKHEKLIGEIMEEGLDGNVGFSTTLSLADQGRFAIGYYHQRQAFFTKSDQSEDEGI